MSVIAQKKIRCTVNKSDSLQFFADGAGFMFETRDYRCHSTTVFPTRKALRELRTAISEYLRATRKKAVQS